MIAQLDSNQDGVLSQNEVKQSRFARQFTRWDNNRDGKASPQEIIRFRARFGIDADGRRIRSSGPPAPAWNVPDLHELPRVTRDTPADARARSQSAFILATHPHPSLGTAYGILTDHTDETYLQPLAQFAKARNAVWIKVPSLADLEREPMTVARVQTEIRKAGIGFLAIAPREDTFHETMLVSIWRLLSTLDEDDQVD
ncbi:MAG: hypothetical protein AAGJ83_05705, partial [Planctomycetota bacterium]